MKKVFEPVQKIINSVIHISFSFSLFLASCIMHTHSFTISYRHTDRHRSYSLLFFCYQFFDSPPIVNRFAAVKHLHIHTYTQTYTNTSMSSEIEIDVWLLHCCTIHYQIWKLSQTKKVCCCRVCYCNRFDNNTVPFHISQSHSLLDSNLVWVEEGLAALAINLCNKIFILNWKII